MLEDGYVLNGLQKGLRSYESPAVASDCMAWVREFLVNREIRVRVEGEISKWVAAPSGAPRV